MTKQTSEDSRLMDWPTNAEAYEMVGKIGQGAFASVWRGHLKGEDQRECAVKVLKLDQVDTNLNEIRMEVQAMRLSSHPNVLACFTAFVHTTDLWLVTPLMRKGSSLHCLQAARRIMRKENKPIKFEDHILYIMRETLLGLQYIHENGQIHRDIKAANLLLDGNGDVKIADFGVSGFLVNAGTHQEKARTFVGTPSWMSPELMSQVDGYDYKTDIWSLGITCLELAKGYAPYAKYPPMKVLILTIQEDPPSLDTYDEENGDTDDDELDIDTEEWSKSFRQFVDTCLQKNPAKRPDASALLQSKYLNSMQDATHRERRKLALKEEVCDLVADVGSQETLKRAAQLPGNSAVSIVLNQEENRPAGTTWVFSDGSQVLASTASEATVDDVMEELDQFGQMTGGEHYTKEKGVSSSSGGTAPNSDAIQDDHDKSDDLDAFMDEFEMNTQGEDFRHPSKSSS